MRVLRQMGNQCDCSCGDDGASFVKPSPTGRQLAPLKTNLNPLKTNGSSSDPRDAPTWPAIQPWSESPLSGSDTEPTPIFHSFNDLDTPSFIDMARIDSCSSFGGGAPDLLSPAPIRDPPKMPLSNYWNSNRPTQYAWLEEVIEPVVQCRNSTKCHRIDEGDCLTPMIVIVGACPNAFCGMQAILLCARDGEVDFWWIKPQASNPSQLERATLDLHSTGPHTNSPGNSRAVYQPLADMFKLGYKSPQVTFGVTLVGGCARAFIDYGGPISSDRLWVYMFWQEKWQTNVFSSRKFVEGKIVYQKTPNEMRFYSRTFQLIAPRNISISEHEDKYWRWPPLPDDAIKDL